MKNNIGEFMVSILLLILLLLFLNPLHFWMPNMLVSFLLLVLIVLFVLFTGFIWKVKAKDERDHIHIMISGRIAYLVGIGVLVLGIVWQEFKGALDPWLLYVLGAMILSKLSTIIYQNNKN